MDPTVEQALRDGRLGRPRHEPDGLRGVEGAQSRLAARQRRAGAGGADARRSGGRGDPQGAVGRARLASAPRRAAALSAGRRRQPAQPRRGGRSTSAGPARCRASSWRAEARATTPRSSGSNDCAATCAGSPACAARRRRGDRRRCEPRPQALAVQLGTTVAEVNNRLKRLRRLALRLTAGGTRMTTHTPRRGDAHRRRARGRLRTVAPSERPAAEQELLDAGLDPSAIAARFAAIASSPVATPTAAPCPRPPRSDRCARPLALVGVASPPPSSVAVAVALLSRCEAVGTRGRTAPCRGQSSRRPATPYRRRRPRGRRVGRRIGGRGARWAPQGPGGSTTGGRRRRMPAWPKTVAIGAHAPVSSDSCCERTHVPPGDRRLRCRSR